MRKALVSLAAGLVLLSAAPVALAEPPPSPYREQLLAQLAAAEEAAQNAGMRRILGPEADGLPQGGVQNYDLRLQGGADYMILGVCDNDCSDLDITLKDAFGAEIASDTLADDAPVVTFSPRTAGLYTLEVKMFACSTAPCYYAVSVYGN